MTCLLIPLACTADALYGAARILTWAGDKAAHGVRVLYDRKVCSDSKDCLLGGRA